MKQVAAIIVLILISSPVRSSAGELDSTSRAPHTYIGLNALDAIGGMVTLSGEQVIAGRHGLLIEAGTDFGDDVSYTLAYHRYSTKLPTRQGLFAPYWGPFIRYGRSSQTVDDPDNDNTYDFDVEALTVGVAFGRAYHLGDHLRLSWRLGYGIPVLLDYHWSPDTYEDADVVETVTSVLVGLEGGLTVGFVF